MGRTFALTAALAGALLVAWLGAKTPDPSPGAVPVSARGFNTSSAMADIRTIARAPHPIGSAANLAVRDHLLARMTALGLRPAIQDGMGLETRDFGGETWVVGGRVQNIVGVLPGKDRAAPALALMAHYDSVPASPGAADDATGTAVVLEVVRALKAHGTPQRDVIVIITDGEEAGLLGARVFFAEHPLRKRIGLLINLESRGGGGRANMFQTGPGNGGLIPIFARTAVSPISNSLAVFLYENMPNDTDFTVSKDAGIRGLNYAFIGRQFDYHSPTSTPANLDGGSVRHMGEQTLAAAAALAFAPALPAAAPDAVYSQTFGDHVLAYPAWGGWIVLLIAAGLLALAVSRARKTEEIGLPDVARGAGAALFTLAAGALLLHLARRATGVEFGFMGQRPLLAQWALWETCLAMLGAGVLAAVPLLLANGGARVWLAGGAVIAGLLCSAFGGWDPVGLGLGVGAGLLGYVSFGKLAGLPGSWLGVLATGLIAAIALQALLPAIAFLVAWPLALAALGAAVSDLGTRMGLSRIAALTLLAALGGGWLAVFFHGVAQGLDLPAILGLFLWLGAFLVWPLATPGRGTPFAPAPAASLLLLGLILLVVVRFSDPWTARHPQATQVLHVRDEITGKSWLASLTRDIDPWTHKVLTADGGKIVKQDLRPVGRRPIWAAASRPGAPGAPSVTTIRLPDGRVQITLPASRVVFLQLTTRAAMTGLSLDGRAIAAEATPAARKAAGTVATPPSERTLNFRLAGMPSPHVVVVAMAGSDDPALRDPKGLVVRYAVFDEAWPSGAKPLPPRPADTMPFDLSDSAVRTGTVTTAF